MKTRIFLLITALLLVAPKVLSSNDIVISEGTATIVSMPGETLEGLRKRALAQARNNAIIVKFGERNVSASTLAMGEDVKAYSSLQSLAAGEWLGDVESPQFSMPSLSDDGLTMSITVKVKGKIRKISAENFDVEAFLLRNGTDDRFIGGTEFYDKDDIFLKFKSPRDCYVAVYLLDPQVACCLLPYNTSTGEAVFVQNNEPYIFFSKDYPFGKVADGKTGNPDPVATYYLIAEDAPEINEIYVIYSKTPFSKAMDMDRGLELPRQTSIAEFQKWLTDLRVKKADVNLKTMQFTVFPK